MEGGVGELSQEEVGEGGGVRQCRRWRGVRLVEFLPVGEQGNKRSDAVDVDEVMYDHNDAPTLSMTSLALRLSSVIRN